MNTTHTKKMRFENLKEQIVDLIKEYDKIIIHRHVRPDPDAYGSQGAMSEIIKETFPQKQVFRAGQHEESLSYLFKPDNLEDDAWDGALVIVTDTGNTERIDDQRYLKAEKIIKIDHHLNREPYGDVSFIEETASSTCELVFELYLHAEKCGFKMNNEAARLLYAGIVADTGRFQFSSTSTKTFKNAAKLVEYDFDRVKLLSQMDEISLNDMRFKGHILGNIELFESCVGKLFITRDMQVKFNVTPEFCSRVASTFGQAQELKTWAIFTEQPTGEIRVNLRSKQIPINEVAEKYNGGGHKFAAGARVETWEEAEKLFADLVEVSMV